jgi:hypothetical protein
MKTPLHRDSRLDELDAEQFERMLASKSWQIYTERLALEWDRLSSRCITEKDDIELRRAQGGALAFQSLMRCPQTLLDELRRQPVGGGANNRSRKAE